VKVLSAGCSTESKLVFKRKRMLSPKVKFIKLSIKPPMVLTTVISTQIMVLGAFITQSVKALVLLEFMFLTKTEELGQLELLQLIRKLRLEMIMSMLIRFCSSRKVTLRNTSRL